MFSDERGQLSAKDIYFILKTWSFPESRDPPEADKSSMGQDIYNSFLINFIITKGGGYGL